MIKTTYHRHFCSTPCCFFFLSFFLADELRSVCWSLKFSWVCDRNENLLEDVILHKHNYFTENSSSSSNSSTNSVVFFPVTEADSLQFILTRIDWNILKKKSRAVVFFLVCFGCCCCLLMASWLLHELEDSEIDHERWHLHQLKGPSDTNNKPNDAE